MAFKLIPKVVSGVKVRVLFKTLNDFHYSLDKPCLYGCTQGHCVARTCLGLLIPVEENRNLKAPAYKDILDNYMLRFCGNSLGKAEIWV